MPGGKLTAAWNMRGRISILVAGFGAQRKQVTFLKDFRSQPENGRSRYGHRTARFAPLQSSSALPIKVCVAWIPVVRVRPTFGRQNGECSTGHEITKYYG